MALGIGALIFLAVKVGSYSNVSRSEIYSVKAPFDNIGNLKTRAPVKSAGVVVGRVRSIKLNQDPKDKNFNRAIVRLDIERKYKFPIDTFASILTSGVLGEQYVGFDSGGDVEELKNEDVMEYTQSAVVLEKLISQFMFNKATETPPPAPAK